MASPFLAEIRLMSFNFAPKGWALCNGQLLPINQNQALFSLLGTTFGGNGTVTFALPDLRSCLPVHMGNGFALGQKAGEEAHTLTQSEMPTHNHFVNASTNPGDGAIPSVTAYLASTANAYTGATNLVAMAATEITSVGGSQPHENRMPSSVINMCIALQGIFPSQN